MTCHFHKIGCDYKDKPTLHHLVPATLCGPDEDWNLIAVCPNHHRLVHKLMPMHKIRAKLIDLEEAEETTTELLYDGDYPADLDPAWSTVMELHKGRDRGKFFMENLGKNAHNIVLEVASSLKADIDYYIDKRSPAEDTQEPRQG